ncbi:DUF2784 domain-containing protein [Myxococcota bacterium]|nr:DUF2784 domain-containing protein [Myxococcota bacterium]
MAMGLADLVLVLHVAFVLFVIGGLVAVWIGDRLRWRFPRRLDFRLVHLGSIAIVVAESWLGIACPLTVLERTLRAQAGGSTHGEGGSFIGSALSRFLYFEAPEWVFTCAYTAFGLAVLATWWWKPPRRG